MFTRRICKNCRWWERRMKSEGVCRTDPNMAYMSGIAVRPFIPGMWAKHDEVRTKPDFGCNQFEAGIPKSIRVEESED